VVQIKRETKEGRTHLEQHATVSIYIGPRILGLALLQEDIGHDLVQLSNQLKHGVIRQVFQSKLLLTGISWISLP
jgi:hypothetical protein